ISLLVPGSIVPFPADFAIYTDFISTGLVLNSLLNFTRMLSPPIETRIICLTVLLFSPGSGGILCGSTNCGAVTQVPTHFFPDSEATVDWAVHDIKIRVKKSTVNIVKQRGTLILTDIPGILLFSYYQKGNL